MPNNRPVIGQLPQPTAFQPGLQLRCSGIACKQDGGLRVPHGAFGIEGLAALFPFGGEVSPQRFALGLEQSVELLALGGQLALGHHQCFGLNDELVLAGRNDRALFLQLEFGTADFLPL